MNIIVYLIVYLHIKQEKKRKYTYTFININQHSDNSYTCRHSPIHRNTNDPIRT